MVSSIEYFEKYPEEAERIARRGRELAEKYTQEVAVAGLRDVLNGERSKSSNTGVTSYAGNPQGSPEGRWRCIEGGTWKCHA